ncbi:DNA repair protein RecO [Paenibacillus melissococcoides]|uniref:DNA repair protein RecO n=1 Tax=Paenibacillus melissococcoides TaxID=2912268 RepID=A0ABM9G1I0_9BACL|nr:MULTISPECIES: DNA repair protein RecO [Paenibacillus]MEB9894004.1 DNA repair protein RecO [Bacillus cereus]CAH8245191.1 DNA repair protein RecO [Paenibacillus melissococcoides]CAH8710241.1 DNA repair protein RecO [Paenibacillus melissococcoides]CAH8711010.1 DNA repair protein RecO [Paenibacillus melissococcoides]GIO81429.1 DNA repair protein RecO [Paenibacillus dendritiformis]
MLYRVEGIVIRSMDYGEGNKIITLCTKSHGKVGVLVRGAKKVRSRHAAATQLFTYGEYVFFRGMGHIGTLNSCEILEGHHTVREQLHLAAYASYAAELVDRALQDEEAGGAMFDQLHAYLEALEAGKDAQVTTHLLEMKLWQRTGVAPQLYACVSCGREDELTGVGWRLGGALCRACLMREHDQYKAGPAMLTLLRQFEKTDLRRLGNVTLKPETKLRLRAFMRGYMDTHVGVRLKSQQFLDQMEKYDLANLDE